VILVDTSVWVDHLRRSNAALGRLLDAGLVVCHPFVIGELALGSLSRTSEVLALLRELPAASVVAHEDALALVERRRLSGRGVGWVDTHLVASAMVERRQIWTRDRRLAMVARELGVLWPGELARTPVD
jgi:predicted nucleic acid-binding protein